MEVEEVLIPWRPKCQEPGAVVAVVVVEEEAKEAEGGTGRAP